MNRVYSLGRETMSFTLSDFHEWARILRENPEWREEAQRLNVKRRAVRIAFPGGGG